jgi:hypothetical protein
MWKKRNSNFHTYKNNFRLTQYGIQDDSPARSDWGWKHEYDLEKMTADMLIHLKESIPT